MVDIESVVLKFNDQLQKS